MELFQLRTFITVARMGHLTRAAEKLATSQPAVSAHIKALEEKLKVSLFIRTSKGMLTTEAGKDLLAHAEKVLNESENLLQRAKSLQTELIGTLRIGLNENGTYLRVGELCKLTSSKYADLRLDILNSSSYAILKDIEEDKLDCGFVFGGYEKNKFSGFFIHSEKIYVTAPICWKERIAEAKWKDLLEFPWVFQIPNCPYRKKIEDLFTNMNLRSPQTVFSADQDATVLAIVTSGSSIGLVKEADAIQAAQQGKIVIWNGGSIELDLFFVFKRERRDDPLIGGISKIVKQAWDVTADFEPLL
jgi:DNA-binding transcriptional LysR family regulator